MRVLVSGAGGLVGSALTSRLEQEDHQIVRLGRSARAGGSPPVDESGARSLTWDALNAADLEDLDAVVHLAGENVAGRRWSREQMVRIRDSRVDPTRRLCELLARTQSRPKVVVCASGAGFYGDRGDRVCTEESPPGNGFLSDTCVEWEEAGDAARAAGIRVVHLRLGMVLSAAGGALGKMLPPFRLGVGGRIGHGRQYMSWIAIQDVVEVILRALSDEEWSGPVNAVTPNPVTNAEFTRILGSVLRRPTVIPVPAPVLRLLLGKMADDLLLASTRVIPQRLLDRDYPFLYPELEPCLRSLLRQA